MKLDLFNLAMGAANLACYSLGSGWWVNLAVGIGCLMSAALGFAVNRYTA